jgi:hypothetical protein
MQSERGEMSGHSRLVPGDYLDDPEIRAGYEDARRAIELGAMVHQLRARCRALPKTTCCHWDLGKRPSDSRSEAAYREVSAFDTPEAAATKARARNLGEYIAELEVPDETLIRILDRSHRAARNYSRTAPHVGPECEAGGGDPGSARGLSKEH